MAVPIIKKQRTNIEKITEIMSFSNYGALAQLFVLDAVLRHSELIANTPIEEMRSYMASGLITPEAWHGVATEIAVKLKEMMS